MQRELPLLSPQDVADSGLCIGCGSCVAQAADPSVRVELDRDGNLAPVGPAEWVGGRTATLARTCPFSPAAANEDELARELFPAARHSDAHVGRFDAAYVGYAAEDGFRDDGSSGGLSSWVLYELLRSGLVDGIAHVVATEDPARDGRFFRYRISRTVDEVRAGAKSRYYPVELSGVLGEIRATPGRYAVVGVPCFVKALQLLRREDAVVRERVAYTVGLFCGHMKSARFVESLAWQLDVPLAEVRAVDFRLKDARRPANWYRACLTLRDGQTVEKDWWHLVDGDWGSGFFQNSACNWCDDVVGETADVSLGDAWVEPYSSDGRGTNVVIVRSPVLHDLIRSGLRERRLALDPVDAAFVARTQAAGFRQRREGLAYRLTWRRRALLRPRKRVAPTAGTLALRRKLIYRMRAHISGWSHRVFRFARATRRPGLYTRWAAATVAVYHALAYSRGRLGRVADRLGGGGG
jgi:coenzyme F420-reducing hydrogenase beta subunit